MIREMDGNLGELSKRRRSFRRDAGGCKHDAPGDKDCVCFEMVWFGLS
jgi:hypothetical protein